MVVVVSEQLLQLLGQGWQVLVLRVRAGAQAVQLLGLPWQARQEEEQGRQELFDR